MQTGTYIKRFRFWPWSRPRTVEVIALPGITRWKDEDANWYCDFSWYEQHLFTYEKISDTVRFEV